MSAVFDRSAFTAVIDAAIEEFRGRELVHAAEALDVLLDLRLTVLDAEALSQFFTAEALTR
jgi:hypothetical protein